MLGTKTKEQWVLVRWSGATGGSYREGELAAVSAQRWADYQTEHNRQKTFWVEVLRGPRHLMEAYEKLTKEQDDEGVE